MTAARIELLRDPALRAGFLAGTLKLTVEKLRAVLVDMPGCHARIMLSADVAVLEDVLRDVAAADAADQVEAA